MTLLEILKMPKDRLIELIQSNSYCVTYEHAWIWFKDTRYPTLVSHIDTVYDDNANWSNRTIIHSQGYYWSPEGIGADDRAGVWAIMKLFDMVDCNCIFTDGEESGGIGAKEIVKNAKALLEDVPYFIQIDRRGHNQCVFYNGEDGDFVTTVTQFFNKEVGTFSDISIIGNELLIASTNLSAGYYHEHQGSGEYLYEPHLLNTIVKVPKLIEALGKEQYKIKPVYDLYRYWRYDTGYYWRNEYVAEIYEELLQVSKHMKMKELVAHYYDLVSLEELQTIKHFFTDKEYKKIEELVKKIEKGGEGKWKKYITQSWDW